MLFAAALRQARTIAEAGELTHGDFTGRISVFDVSAAIENLAMGATSVSDALALWRQSPRHKAGLLMKDATRMALARVDADTPYWALVLAR